MCVRERGRKGDSVNVIYGAVVSSRARWCGTATTALLKTKSPTQTVDYLKEDDCYPVIVSDQGTDTCGSCWKRVLVVLNSMHGEFIARGEDIKIHTCCWPLENKILKCIVKGNGRICELWKRYGWEMYMASYDNILIHTFVGKYLDYLRIYWRL